MKNSQSSDISGAPNELSNQLNTTVEVFTTTGATPVLLTTEQMNSDPENVYNSMNMCILVLGLIAKLLSTFYWPFIETYNAEINPTVIRDSVAGLTRYKYKYPNGFTYWRPIYWNFFEIISTPISWHILD